MKFRLPILIAMLCNAAVDTLANESPAACANSAEPMLQVLGSGGPIADDGRASTGYLIWIDGKSRFLIDAGGGIFLRFGEAGARFDDLNHIAISHFHTDHSTDLSALLKSGYFSNRTRKLTISGPAASGDYPATDDYLKRLLDQDHGVYAYLGGYLDGSAGLVELEPIVIDQKLKKSSKVYENQDADIEMVALGVPHGPVPALAYRVRIGQQSIVFSGDQNGNSDGFIEFARGTDVLVMHMPVPENVGGVGRKLHAPPSLIGKIAAETGAGKLVLSHFMARSLENKEENLQQIKSRFSGTLVSAVDLECVGF
ncbi:MAG: MBL fold metallo-hydrolase [Lysobacterales bacterium]